MRFQLPAPQSGLKASEEEWTKAVDNAATQLMHQEGRLTNLELLKRYGGEYAMTACPRPQGERRADWQG